REMTFLSKSTAILVLVFAFAGFVQAMRPGHTLEEMANKSDTIVHATVKKVGDQPVLRSPGRNVYAATVDVQTCFKKMVGPFFQTGKTLQFMYLTGGPELPDIQVGKQYIFFLKESEVGPYPYEGIEGVLPIVGGRARTLLISQEPMEQDADRLK